MAKKKEQKVKKVIQEIERLGKCLRCGKLLVKDHKTCSSCRRKKMLQKKANKRGKSRNHYL